MPKKINVVSLSDVKPVEEDTVESNNDERNQITEAIKEEESLNPPVVDQPIEEAKAKPKRKPAAKKAKVIEEESVVVEPVVEPVAEQLVEVKEEPAKKVKTLELVKCEKCNKEMTKRTLRYDHDKTCKGAPINREDIPVQKRVKKTNSPKQQQQTPPQTIIPEHIIEQEVKKRIQSTLQDRVQQRLKLKEERIKKLSANIA
jgi:ssDNA-binding Zn-finger/Zn-ribbon topoisomerase 1